MRISVIIPTLDRPDYLVQCLAALLVALGRRSDVEIIVVDDGSLSVAKQRNRALCMASGARYLEHERTRGMAVARNTGLARASGEWVAFIDDDVCVEKGWGAALDGVLTTVDRGVAGIEGAVQGSGGGLWDHEVEVRRGGSCLTCHIVYRRCVLERAGWFDPQFEFEGPFHEDQELAVRVRQFGAIIFEPSLRATHLPRHVSQVRYLSDAPARIEKLLRADFYFWSRHPAAYHDFRHARSFWGTYTAVLLKYPWTTIRRRTVRQILTHPIQALVLVLACVTAQIRAWTLIPYFIWRARTTPRPMTVWFAAAIPPSSQGGVKRLMCGLAQGLARQGMHTRLIYDKRPKAGYIGFAVRLAIRFLCTPRRPDWIIARSTDAFFCVLVRRICRLRTRIILHNHGWEEYAYEVQRRLPASMIEHPATWKARLIRFPMLRATLALSDLCLCGTVDDLRWIVMRYPRMRAKLRYVPNGVDPQPACFWAGHAKPLPQVLWVGTWTWRKNAAYALAIFRHLTAADPRTRLVMVGTGKIPAARIVDHDERIMVVPSVTMEQMERWYRQCPYILHTARYEGGHPLALLEAMSFGVVPFVVPIPSVAEIVRHGINGMHLDGSDSRAAAAIIAATVADVERSAALARHACATALRHRWERQSGRLERILRSV